MDIAHGTLRTMKTALAALLVVASAVSAASVDPGGQKAPAACPPALARHRSGAGCAEPRLVCFVDESRERIVCLTPWHASPASQPRTQGVPRAPRVPLWLR